MELLDGPDNGRVVEEPGAKLPCAAYCTAVLGAAARFSATTKK